MALILVADDEPIVVRLLCLVLRRDGHTLHATVSGATEEACQIASTMARLDVLIVGYALHHGRKTAEQILARHPKAKVLHMSGYSREYLNEQGCLMPGAGFLAKPFTHGHVRDAVKALLAA